MNITMPSFREIPIEPEKIYYRDPQEEFSASSSKTLGQNNKLVDCTRIDNDDMPVGLLCKSMSRRSNRSPLSIISMPRLLVGPSPTQ